ncbi:MAG: beta strand repeat-containing protein, partial [Polymorphobacter sp.]
MVLPRQFRLMLLGAASVSAMSAAHASDIAVSSGTASIQATANTRTITQTSARAIINWSNLSVAAGDTLTFVQPNSNSITLNRVVGSATVPITRSQIDGTIAANGQVWILNPAGVLVGATGRVNVAGFLATTLAIADSDFDAATNAFTFSGDSTDAITNQGEITASGYAVLAGNRVDNSGLVQANLGTVALGSGQALAVSFTNDKLISFAVSAPATGTTSGLFNADGGELIADGGRVLMTARAASSTAAAVINAKGMVQARSASIQNGQIILDAGPTGRVDVSGTLDAGGTASGQTGGSIIVTGQRVYANSGSSLLATGHAGGGTIAIGQAPLPTAPPTGTATGQTQQTTITSSGTAVYILSGSTLDASAINAGNGGKISLLSDYQNAASFIAAGGAFFANGGSSGGAGGAIEAFFSTLDLTGSGSSLATRSGEAASFIINSNSIEISQTSGGYGKILSSDIEQILNAGRRLSINAIGQGTTSGHIAINAGFSKTSSAASTLTLSANYLIDQAAVANISSTAGTLDINFNADVDNDGIGFTRLRGNISLNGTPLLDGLIGIKYEGYYDDNYIFFANAAIQQDSRFSSPFISINPTTPGTDIDETYSVKFSGYFRPAVSGLYNFTVGSDDASQLFLGPSGQSVNILQQNIITSEPIDPLVNNAGLHGLGFVSANTSQPLVAGQYYPIVVLFGENGGGDVIHVLFAPDGQELSDNGLGTYFYTPNGELVKRSNLTFSGGVRLGADVSLTTQGDILFLKPVDSENNTNGVNLNIDAGTGSVKFLGAVGGAKELSGLTVKSGSFEATSLKILTTGLVKIDAAYDSTISGVVTAANLTKAGTGTLKLLGDANVADVSIEAGRLRSLTAAGTGLLNANSVMIGADGVLDLTAAATAPIISLKSVSGGGQIDLGDDKALEIISGRPQDVFSGTITGGPTSAFMVSGGTVTLSSDPDFAGQITVGSATLKLVGSASLPSVDSLTFAGANGGVLDISGLTASSTTISNFFTDTASRSGSVLLGAKTLVIDTTSESIGFNGLTFTSTSAGGGLEKTGDGTLILTGTNTYSGATTISAGELIFENDTPSLSSASFDGAGELVIRPTGSSFAGAFSTAGLNLGNNLGGFTIGKVGNTADLTLGIINIAGPITAHGGNVFVTGALTAAGSSAVTLTGTQSIDLKGSGSIVSQSGDVFLTAPLLYVRNGAGSAVQTSGNIDVTTSEQGNLNNDHLRFANRSFDATDISVLTTGGFNFLLGLKHGNTAGLFIEDIRNLNATGTLTLGSGVDYSALVPDGLNVCGSNCRMTVASGFNLVASDLAGNLKLTHRVIDSNSNSSFTLGTGQSLTLANFGSQGATSSFASTISGTGSLIKAGAAALTLSGTNTYSGTTTVSAGTLTFANRNALYNAASGSWTVDKISVASGATLALRVAGGDNVFTETDVQSIAALGVAAGGFMSGAILGLDTNGGTFSYSNVLANPNGGNNVLGLSKLGAGTLTLTVSNTYSGGTTISAGSLIIGGAGTAGAGALSIASGSVFDYASSASQTLSGAITGAGTLSKSGNGTLTLIGVNTYSGGTTISTGSLIIGGAGT